MLAKKDAEEAAALDELRALARKELADWYSRHDDQVGQTKVSNRFAIFYSQKFHHFEKFFSSVCFLLQTSRGGIHRRER